MKKTIIFVVAVILLLSCVACDMLSDEEKENSLVNAIINGIGSTDQGTTEEEENPLVNAIINGIGSTDQGTTEKDTNSVKNVVIELNGGIMDVPSGVTFDAILQYKPTKDGYDFVGWYSDVNCTDRINPSSMTEAQKEKGTAYAKWIQVKPSVTYTVRTNSATITDSGRENQIMDVVYLANDYDLTDLAYAGYTRFKVTISLDIAEKDSGYQYIFFYRDTKVNTGVDTIDELLDKYVDGRDPADPSHLGTFKYEHGGDDKATYWGQASFTTYISLSDLYDSLYIRYGASGKNEDTWYNNNVIVTVVPMK